MTIRVGIAMKSFVCDIRPIAVQISGHFLIAKLQSLEMVGKMKN